MSIENNVTKPKSNKTMQYEINTDIHILYSHKAYAEYLELVDDKALEYKGSDSYDLLDLLNYIKSKKINFPELYVFVFPKDSVLRTTAQAIFGLSVAYPSLIKLVD